MGRMNCGKLPAYLYVLCKVFYLLTNSPGCIFIEYHKDSIVNTQPLLNTDWKCFCRHTNHLLKHYIYQSSEYYPSMTCNTQHHRTSFLFTLELWQIQWYYFIPTAWGQNFWSTIDQLVNSIGCSLVCNFHPQAESGQCRMLRMLSV